MFGIVDTDSGIILATTENITLANMLMEIPPDTFLVTKFTTIPGYELIKSEGKPIYNYYYQRYPNKMIGVVDESRSSLRPNAREISELYTVKAKFGFMIVDMLRYHRLKHSTVFEFQGAVFEEKARQARDLLLRKIPNDQDHFYVTTYASVIGLDPINAAKIIKLKHEMFHQELALNEALRIKYFNIIKNATSADEVGSAYQQFHKETFFNQRADKDSLQ